MAVNQRATTHTTTTPHSDEQPAVGLTLIATEQMKQRTKYSQAHDDGHVAGELAAAAAALAVDDADCVRDLDGTDFVGDLVWISGKDWMTPLVRNHRDDRIHQLAIAGALIASEIDRLLRRHAVRDRR